MVAYNGRYSGTESKNTLGTIKYTNDDTIMQVESNLPNNFAGSAIIENLIIDGRKQQPNAYASVGLLLENVYNCWVRNLTIMNCDVGIRVKIADGGFWAHGNRFEHIRMKNVKTGILFEGNSSNGAKYFSYTTIDDVRISLDREDSVGIMVGKNNEGLADLYGAFIKATVWMCKATQKGLVVNGSLRYSLVNLEVEQVIKSVPSGYGVFINSGAVVRDNQGFLLTALWLNPPSSVDRRLSVNGGADCAVGEITVFSRDNV
jgi:hypothetical protein